MKFMDDLHACTTVIISLFWKIMKTVILENNWLAGETCYSARNWLVSGSVTVDMASSWVHMLSLFRNVILDLHMSTSGTMNLQLQLSVSRNNSLMTFVPQYAVITDIYKNPQSEVTNTCWVNSNEIICHIPKQGQ